jgi:uncharacterized protein (DUF2235 family)
MLDRSGLDHYQYHYYQPGIGTYVTSTSLSSPGRIQKIKSAYSKAKAAALGSTLADHVMGGYKYLMQYYFPGDRIYFFGFSRGAYVARFLAEMLDTIGLLETGNEEMVRFAWEIFAKWQRRRPSTSEDQVNDEKLVVFRETFCRPISQICFLGLFDTVNSVPRFENAWMQRSQFPYTARTTAKVICHAVSIDERRAKFRQDLISEVKPTFKVQESHLRNYLERHRVPLPRRYGYHYHRHGGQTDRDPSSDGHREVDEASEATMQVRRSPHTVYRPVRRTQRVVYRVDQWADATSSNPRDLRSSDWKDTKTKELQSSRADDASSAAQLPTNSSCSSITSVEAEEVDEAQAIEEVWFPGCHADIGGGWALEKGEEYALSHAPLAWMVQKAQKAGLRFNKQKLKHFHCSEEVSNESEQDTRSGRHRKDHEKETSTSNERTTSGKAGQGPEFERALQKSSTDGKLHDSLQFKGGLPWISVLSWKIMEYLPFRRMDLQKDGSWKPIRWPLPCGEVRDVPNDAKVHVSAINRMKTNPDYRPGNLIMGGGGRGMRKAPEEHGIGEWEVADLARCSIEETYLRKQTFKTPAQSSH